MLLFDLDGTLVDSGGIWLQIDIDFTSRRNLPHTKEYHDFVAHTTAPTAAQFTKDYYQLDMSIGAIMKEWSDQALYEYSNNIVTKPHVCEYLEQCRKQGERMAILTSSSPELCHATLKKNHLAGYFDHLFFAQELGLEKHDPALFQCVAKALQVPVEDCLLYDDSPVSCRNAKKAGMQVIAVHDALFAEDEDELRSFCDGYIRDFSELLKYES